MNEKATYSIRRSDSYLIHYGVSGQKKGVRRFQNDDGTLTAEGREHYGVGDGSSQGVKQPKNYSSKDGGMLRTLAKSSWYGRKTAADMLANTKGERGKAQREANEARKKYEDKTSTAKLVAQDLLFGKHGAQNYRAARARGAGKVRSFFETTAGVGLIGTVLAAKGNKKKYGKHVVLGAPKDREYDAMAMDRD